MSNVNDSKKGLRVISLAGSRVQRTGSDFPGWGRADAASFLREPVAGLRGTVVNVESHGSNPWTRYAVAWDDGCRSNGLVAGVDVAFLAVKS